VATDELKILVKIQFFAHTIESVQLVVVIIYDPVKHDTVVYNCLH